MNSPVGDPRVSTDCKRAQRAWTLDAIVFAILMLSYAYFWHSRDWNTSARLMLTYALVDHGTVILDGYKDHSRDFAVYHGRYYCDKTPGYSLLAVPVYALARVCGLRAHPLGASGPSMPYWIGDYLCTLAVSGITGALSAILIARLARALGCSLRISALLALAYGLATPMQVYSSLAYGHVPVGFCLLASFALIRSEYGLSLRRSRAFCAGFLAAYASVIELQAGPLSALLGVSVVVLTLTGARRATFLLHFSLGAAVPTLILLGYNQWAFGHPLDLGYFHLNTPRFARIHGRDNPLGVGAPRLEALRELFIGRDRGLFFYAPITLFAVPGWLALMLRRQWFEALFSLAAVVAHTVVIAGYPEYSGGWATGPRLLLPMVPFLMLPIAGLAAGHPRVWLVPIALASAYAMGVMLMFQGLGGRIPDGIREPIATTAVPFYAGGIKPQWAPAGGIERNMADGFTLPGRRSRIRDARPLVIPIALVQALALAALLVFPHTRNRKA